MRFGRIVFGLMAVLGLCFPVCAQSRRIDGGFASTGKFAFYWETHLDPSVPELANVGGGSATDSATGTIHRFMADRGRRVYFGYDVSIQALPEPMTYRVTFTQLSLSPDLARRALLVDDLSTWTQVRTPGWGDPSVRII